MAYATEVHLLIQDLNQSPFNVGLQLTLQDFTLEQIENLNGRYGAPLDSKAHAERFYRLLGGSPYLVHRGLYELVTRPMDLATLEEKAAHESGCFGDHLQRIDTAIRQDTTLYDVVRDHLDGRQSLSSKSFYRLKSAGVLIGEEPECSQWRSRTY